MKKTDKFEVGDLVRLPFSMLIDAPVQVAADGTAVVTEVYQYSRRVKWIRVIAHWGQEFVRKPEWVEIIAKGNCK